jgi:hypothetical protein
MPEPLTCKARNLRREAQALIEQAAVQHAKSSTSRIHKQSGARGNSDAQDQEAFVHTDDAAG